MYPALNAGQIDVTRLRIALARLPLPRGAGTVEVTGMPTAKEEVYIISSLSPHRTLATLRNLALGALRQAGWRNIASGLRKHARLIPGLLHLTKTDI